MDIRAGNKASPTDVFIALMGMTGSGKSSFISHCVKGKKPKIGHNLKSETEKTQVYRCTHFEGRNVYLIDTPGFDDTNKSDTDILRELATWFGVSYQNEKLQLHGIIYLHRISANRLQGSMRSNLPLLKLIVGPKNLKTVVLTTTFWEDLKLEDATRFETELINEPEFWGDLIKNKCTTYRHITNTKESAIKLVKRIVDNHKPVVWDLQKQLVDDKMSLDKTSAGKFMIDGERAPYEKRLHDTQTDLAQAIAKRDKESQKALEQMEKLHKKQLEDLKKEHKRMETNLEALWKSKLDRVQKQVQDLQNQNLSLDSAAASNPRKQSTSSGRTSPNDTKDEPEKGKDKTKNKDKDKDKDKGKKDAGNKTKLPLLTPNDNIPGSRPKTPNDGAKTPPGPRSKSPNIDFKKFIRSKKEYHLNKPGCRASFCLPWYSLDGPNKHYRHLPCELKEDYQISLGVNGSWIAFIPGNENSEILTSANFAKEYPGLVPRLTSDKLSSSGPLKEVVLGSDKRYWVDFKNKYAWNLKADISTKLETYNSKPEIVTLGVKDSYIVKWADGKVDSELPDDKYKSFDRKVLSSGKPDDRIKMVALDPNGVDYICITASESLYRSTKATDKQRFGIEEWCTVNAGTAWNSSSRKLDTGELVPTWLK